METGTSKPHDKAPILLGLAITACCSVLLIQIFRWPLVNILTVFLEPLLELGVYLFLFVIFIWALIRMLKTIFNKNWSMRASVPLLICTCAASVAYCVPFDTLMLQLNFKVDLKRRTTIAQSLVAGKPLAHFESNSGRGDRYKLQGTDYALSDDGDVDIWRENGQTAVIFFTFRGILDSFSGFIYTSDDAPPPKDAFLGNVIESKKLAPHWYWYASRN